MRQGPSRRCSRPSGRSRTGWTPLCRLYGDMEEKKWLDNQEVCLLLKVSPRTLQTLRDNGTLAYTQICHKTYYKPGDVESIIRIVEERRKRAENMGRSI